MAEDPQVGPCSPFLIISSIKNSLAHYVDALGFTCSYQGPIPDDVYFVIVNRGSAQIMLKVITEDVKPLPNHRHHHWASWDIFIYVSDPDALAQEFTACQVRFHRPLQTNDEDGLRGFEVADPDGYICYFGRPVE